MEFCPPGYLAILSNDEAKNTSVSICTKCHEKCPKTCKNLSVIRKEIQDKHTKFVFFQHFFSIQSGGVSQLEKLGTGCTIIEGDLEINIVEDVANLTDELKTYLGSVEVIRGFLKIHRFFI